MALTQPRRTQSSVVAAPAGIAAYTPGMDRRSALVLLVVFGAGVFLAGLELMITAVALPSILDDLADPAGGSAWIQLRKASWIINGYLLVYILTMPLAGRLTDLWGARRPFMGALAVFIVGSVLAGLAQSLDQLIGARLVQALGGGVLVPVGTAAAAHLYEGASRPRALGVVGALTFLGMAAGPFVGAALLASVHAEGALEGAGLGGSWPDLFAPAWRWVFFVNVPIGLIALILGWAASAGWDTPRRPGRVDVVGALWFGAALVAGLVGLTLIGTTEIAGKRGRTGRRDHGPAGRGRGPDGGRGGPRPARPRSVPRSAALRDPGVRGGRARLAADRLRVRDRHHRWRGLRRPGAVWRTR